MSKPATAPAPAAQSFEFTDAPIPVVSAAGPNPFLSVVAALEINSGSKVFAVPGPKDAPPTVALVRQLRAAGNPVSKSVKTKLTTDGEGDAAVTTVTFWTVPKIERPRAGKSQQDDGAAEETPAPAEDSPAEVAV